MTDITRKRGDTYADEFVIRNETTGVPMNIVGCSFFLTVDPNQFPTSAASNSYKLTGAILDAAGGRVGFAPSETQANLVGRFYYDVEMIDTASRKRTVASGKYTYQQDIGK
jgi:hypothetical protein